MQFDLTLAAGLNQRQDTAGAYFMILADGGTSWDVQIMRGGAAIEELRGMKRGTKLRVPGRFDWVNLKPQATATGSFIISDGMAEIDVLGTSTTPILVSNDRGSPGTPINVVGVTINDAPATSITAPAAVAMGAAAVQIVAANANRRTVRFTNLGANAVAIGPAGITWAARCIVLNPGDTWVEERAGVLAWFGITAAAASSIGIQEVIA